MLDILRPTMDRWQVLRKIRENPRSSDTPVIGLSGRNGDPDINWLD
jgi:CheY-like chemotaxis protein